MRLMLHVSFIAFKTLVVVNIPLFLRVLYLSILPYNDFQIPN